MYLTINHCCPLCGVSWGQTALYCPPVAAGGLCVGPVQRPRYAKRGGFDDWLCTTPNCLSSKQSDAMVKAEDVKIFKAQQAAGMALLRENDGPDPGTCG
jgi:hypothetical protein